MPTPTDGLIIVAKRDCPTCTLIEPVIRDLARRDGGFRVVSQDDPKFPSRVADIVDDRELARPADVLPRHLQPHTPPPIGTYAEIRGRAATEDVPPHRHASCDDTDEADHFAAVLEHEAFETGDVHRILEED